MRRLAVRPMLGGRTGNSPPEPGHREVTGKRGLQDGSNTVGGQVDRKIRLIWPWVDVLPLWEPNPADCLPCQIASMTAPSTESKTSDGGGEHERETIQRLEILSP
jgi:hypothetical protein